MKNYLKIGSIVATIVTLFIIASATMAFTQTPDTPDEQSDEQLDELLDESVDEVQEGDEVENGRLPRPHLHQRHPGFLDHEARQAIIADTLGVTVEELEAARADGQTIADLAEEQGVDTADIEAALEAARIEAVQQAVEEGVITQEQADQILSQEVDLLCAQGARGGRQAQFIDRATIQAAIADALGITVEELEAAQADGQTLPELAEELGVDLADVQAAVEAARDEAIQQALEDGLITEEEAERLRNHEGRPGPRGHGFRGQGNGPRGFAPAPQDSAAPLGDGA